MQKRTTIKDIASRAGVSIRAVSLAINGEKGVSTATRETILRIAKDMDYTPNVFARGLAGNKSFLIGVNFPYLNFSFLSAILAGIEKRTVNFGYEILLCSSSYDGIAFMENDLDNERRAVERMLSRRVDAIVCLPDPRAYELYKGVLDKGIPVLQLLRTVPHLPAPFLRVDNESGAFDETNHLLELGHRQVGFIGYLDDSFTEVNERHRGYQRAMMNRDYSLDFGRVTVGCDLSYEGGFSAMKTLLERSPLVTAAVVATDYAALGAVSACLDSGLRVPEDISVVGFDDLQVAALQTSHPLTTVCQPKELLGELAFDLAYKMINGETVESVTLRPPLVIRKSSGPVRPADQGR
jgi:LacI family transcriptional regulator